MNSKEGDEGEKGEKGKLFGYNNLILTIFFKDNLQLKKVTTEILVFLD